MMLHLKDKLKMLSEKVYQKLALFWTFLLMYLSLISARQAAILQVWDIFGIDKIGHLSFYASLTFLWSMALRSKKISNYFVLFFSICFGVLMEICQLYLFNGRSFEVYDIIANIVGSFVGLILFKNLIN